MSSLVSDRDFWTGVILFVICTVVAGWFFSQSRLHRQLVDRELARRKLLEIEKGELPQDKAIQERHELGLYEDLDEVDFWDEDDDE